MGWLLLCLVAVVALRLAAGFARRQSGAARSRSGTPLTSPQWPVKVITAPPPRAAPLTLPAFLQDVQQQWEQQLGSSVRPLAPAELAVLARRAGFIGGLAPDQPPLPPRAATTFDAWLSCRLEMLAAVAPALHYRPARLVAGFDVGRAEALEQLQGQPPGTFVLRLGSVADHLVLSLVTEEQAAEQAQACGSGASSVLLWEGDSDDEGGGRGGHAARAAPRSVAHFLLGLPALRLGGLNRIVREVEGCRRLLDASTGQAHHVGVLRKAEKAALAAAAAAPGRAASVLSMLVSSCIPS
ncbi:hypothetical protein ABPG75_006143 [Micractinium tetrahymenae]